jgi:hypothetical protein
VWVWCGFPSGFYRRPATLGGRAADDLADECGVASDGKVGGFSANGGVTTKRRMLVIEGALADEVPLF